MTLHPQAIAPIPEETVRVARVAFPKGNLYLRMRDGLGVFFNDTDFAQLYPKCGHLAEAPWRLALLRVMQYVEGYSDRQAADGLIGNMPCRWNWPIPVLTTLC